jgi:hypothetical protein
MRRYLAIALTALAATTSAASAQATQTLPGWAALKTYAGTIVRVDAAARTVTARNAAGETAVFEAPPALASAQLSTFAPGDPITVTFYEGVEVRRRTAGGSMAATSVDPATGLRTATVTLTGVDMAARTITFIGPRGRYTRTVPAGVDTSTLQSVIIGDRVDLSYFEYVVSMTKSAGTSTAAAAAVPGAPAPAGAALSNRVSVTFLYGLDNSFTGRMIEAASGRTTTGVPIELTDTSYDDVYGRLGLIKVGVGYQMTPRMEAVANFVYSNSSASFEATPIGTAGAAGQVPLNVNFTNYRYVGVEVGQRFSFPQGNRVAPFAGWIVGLNRNQDIRGTFVGVPQSSLPGLAAQDGKFFERSWAFSLGPTGGVLINAGPIDVIAETGLRFLGGLSDVDWLVEEGLRDINSKSERWSVPFMAGVRFRFK